MDSLIVGADSLIGGALLKRLKLAGERVIGSSRRKEPGVRGNIYLDLADPDLGAIPKARTALLLAGISKVDTCASDPEWTARINVDGVMSTLNKLIETGAYVIYLSTSQVFDGSTEKPGENDPVAPITEYGRQRAEVERRILGKRGVAVLRITKVIESSYPLLGGWVKQLGSGDEIHPFSDMTMAPVSLAGVVSVLRFLLDTRPEGVFHFSGGYDISYADVAEIGVRSLGIGPSLVKPAPSPPYPSTSGKPPGRTALACGRIRMAMGMEPLDVKTLVANSFRKIAGLAPSHADQLKGRM
jgi:dTDP-4-dehydrorhamnose reductase